MKYKHVGKIDTIENFNKVFNIGLSRTGTTSVGNALRKLGFIVNDYLMGTPEGTEMMNQFKSGDYDIKYLDKFDAMVDIVPACYYAQLDKHYPNSKFILTVRPDMKLWLKSCKKHWAKHLDNKVRLAHNNGFIMTAVYGSWKFNAERFRYVYKRHRNDVMSYFKNRMGLDKDFIILNVTGNSSEDNWHMLCNFLGMKIPNIKFPHSQGSANKKPKLNELTKYGRKVWGYE